MRFLRFLGLLSFVALSTQQNVASYVQTETPIAKAGILANIGPSGSKSSGAASGIVIASPSTTNPDYLFTWTRDSSLVFKTLIDQYVSGQDTSLLGQINNFITAESKLQQVSNPSGGPTTGGLGEPKFNVDGSAFTGPWGRPQRDGPALRATAMITFANYLLSHGNTTFVTQTLWPIIQNDLTYVQNFWNQSSFDLWEEINSSSFFTTAVQHRSLREGATLATTLGQTSASSGFTTQAVKLLCFLQSYWNSAGSYITANTGGGRVAVDANTVLASIHTYDINAGCDATTFQPCSDKALANHKVYVDSFRGIYSINSGNRGPGVAAATGRYPEDVYMNGNPWYLTTFAAAEQLYVALNTWASVGSIQVTSISQPFFAQFVPSIATGTYASSSSTYTTLTSAIRTYADGFLALNAKYTPSNGGLAEQFGKNNGSPVSAVDLTWSYASAITAFQTSTGVLSNSWGAKGLTVASSCVVPTSSSPTVVVTFTVQATTVLGENIYLTGSVSSLSNWNTNTALIMDPTDYPTWKITVTLPANTAIQYKYVRINNGAVTWESDPNNSFTTPSNGATATADTWR
ncbi:carbohydrate-binding module family 20 protein [Sphaerobolus stellatus SS14]|uniref:Glucoamylase n=1 Tax=Sphaerobolus stellatus (strain SS14) TaxID=990650 RepID=A0A0C9VRL5_SPHS4|nr:carbohydrate-binding module family 20 protein [Sphaerobolus stellatus SS14]